MLTKIYPLLLPRSGKFLGEWKECVTDNKQLFDYSMARYNEMPFLVNDIIKRIKAILLYIDVGYIDTLQAGDLDIYLSYIEPLRFKIESYIRSSFPNTTNGPWCRSKSTYECVIPVMSVDPLQNLPIDQPYEQWKLIKPIRILSHDSIECCYDVTQPLQFRVFHPSVFLFTIDIDKLILKFIHWRKTLSHPGEMTNFLYGFIYKDLYLPLAHDLLHIWFFNLIDRCINMDNINDIQPILQIQSYKIRYNTTLIGLTQLYRFFNEGRNNNLAFENVIGTVLFDSKTIIDLLQDSILNNRTYELMQYKHYELLIEIRLIHLLYNMRKLNAFSSGQKPIDVVFDRFIDRYFSNKITNQFKHPALKEYVESRLFDITNKR